MSVDQKSAPVPGTKSALNSDAEGRQTNQPCKNTNLPNQLTIPKLNKPIQKSFLIRQPIPLHGNPIHIHSARISFPGRSGLKPLSYFIEAFRLSFKDRI
jgi:hypothetical protein